MSWKYKQNTTKPGNPLWNEYVEVDNDGNETGRSTLETITPNKITQFDSCDHYFEYIDNGNSARCRTCGYGFNIVLGIHLVKDGKIIKKVKL